MHTDMQTELPERRRHSADVILSEHEIFVEGGAVPKTKKCNYVRGLVAHGCDRVEYKTTQPESRHECSHILDATSVLILHILLSRPRKLCRYYAQSRSGPSNAQLQGIIRKYSGSSRRRS